jgi:hypothetical protein
VPTPVVSLPTDIQLKQVDMVKRANKLKKLQESTKQTKQTKQTETTNNIQDVILNNDIDAPIELPNSNINSDPQPTNVDVDTQPNVDVAAGSTSSQNTETKVISTLLSLQSNVVELVPTTDDIINETLLEDLDDDLIRTISNTSQSSDSSQALVFPDEEINAIVNNEENAVTFIGNDNLAFDVFTYTYNKTLSKVATDMQIDVMFDNYFFHTISSKISEDCDQEKQSVTSYFYNFYKDNEEFLTKTPKFNNANGFKQNQLRKIESIIYATMYYIMTLVHNDYPTFKYSRSSNFPQKVTNFYNQTLVHHRFEDDYVFYNQILQYLETRKETRIAKKIFEASFQAHTNSKLVYTLLSLPSNAKKRDISNAISNQSQVTISSTQQISHGDGSVKRVRSTTTEWTVNHPIKGYNKPRQKVLYDFIDNIHILTCIYY